MRRILMGLMFTLAAVAWADDGVVCVSKRPPPRLVPVLNPHASKAAERDRVRSFALASDGDGHLTGSAWRGRQRFAMRCERVERAPPAAHAERSVGLQFP